MILRNVSLMMVLNLLKAAATLLLSFLITRYVPPAEYGLIAFALPFVAFLSLLTDLGIASAILRERDLTHKQAGATVSLMTALGVFACFALSTSAAWIESESGVAGAEKVLEGFAVVTLMQVWATAPRALLERIHSYGKVAGTEGFSLLLALVVFFVTLLTQPGIFALVYYHMALQTSRALIFLFVSRKCFSFALLPRGIGSLIHAGGWIFIANMLSYASRNLDKLIVGKQMGQADLGMYGFAYQFMTIPLVLLAWPASNILISTLSSAGENIAVRRDVARAFIGITALIAVPLGTYISLGLDYPLHRFLSNHWDGVEKYIAILMPVGVLQCIAVYATGVLVSNGRFRVNFVLGLVNGISIPLVMFLSAPFGLLVFVESYAGISVFVSSLMIFYMCSIGGLNFKSLFLSLYPGVFSSALGGVIAYLSYDAYLAYLEPEIDLLGWLLCSAAYIFGVLLGYILCRREIKFSLSVMKKSRSDILSEA